MALSSESPQWAELLDTLRRVEQTSPFYREKFATAGMRASDVRTPEDFRRLPLTRKAEVPAAQKATPPFGSLLAVPEERIGSVHVSPGPLYIPRTADEPTGVEALHESLHAMGVKRSDVAHVTLSYHIMPGGLRLHRAFESYGCRVINGGVGNSEMQVRVASDLGATVYVGTPSFLGNLADVATTLGLPLRYRIGFSTAEALTPQLRAEMRARLGIELFNHCGEALIGPLAGECRYHDGMHLHQREMWIEFLDPESGEAVPPGGVGELVATQLGERAMPLVRYAPGDVYRTWAEPCPCGDPAPRVDIIGQVGVIRKIRGVLVHPAQVKETLSAFPELGRFQIVVEHAEGTRYDHGAIRIGCDASVDRVALAERVRDRLRANILLQLDVELVPTIEIPEGAGAPLFADTFVDKRGIKESTPGIQGSRDQGKSRTGTVMPNTDSIPRSLDPLIPSRKYWRPDMQTLPREQLRALQLARLQRLLQRVWERPIPFFRRKLEAGGMTPADVRSLDDLRGIPTTIKNELRASDAEHPPLGDYRGATLDDCVRVGCSTGTSGKPTLILWTRHDQAVDLEGVCRGRWRWGLRPGSSLAHGHPFGMYGGGISFSKGIEALGLLNIPCAPPANTPWTREVVQLLAAVKPGHYRFFGNAGAQYADAARAANFDPERDLHLQVQGEDPQEQYKSVSAGLEALGMLGTACDENDGAHVAEDLAIAEVINRHSGRPVSDGERGSLVVTVLEKDNAVLRYDLQDIVRLNLKPCPCGETHTRLFYEGRVADIVPVGEHEVLPIDVLLALSAAPVMRGVALEYQIVRRKRVQGVEGARVRGAESSALSPQSPALTLRVEHPAAGDNGVATRVAEAVRSRLDVPVQLEVLAVGALPRFAFKAARVVDET